ncbi:Protein 21.1 [Giardia duodenalis assemblage B]|uniref:Protein 21.1 n=3 Tax=Giardia intestinalis TaxID=5741 RepID=A0A132NN34_GIAIN|nr:Protein 21.1 [Giardia intestinalis ATCC 50581]ESU40924.1 Ankyrin repeat protein [Giardia intestinalis]KWX11503.1 Protein 21.1 [Giardia intestinalis assemblage B]
MVEQERGLTQDFTHSLLRQLPLQPPLPHKAVYDLPRAPWINSISNCMPTLEHLILLFTKREMRFLEGMGATLALGILERSILIHSEGCTPLLTPEKIIVPGDYLPLVPYVRSQCTELSIIDAFIQLVDYIKRCIQEKEVELLAEICEQGSKSTLKRMSKIISNYFCGKSPYDLKKDTGTLFTAAELGLTRVDDVRSFTSCFSMIPFTIDLSLSDQDDYDLRDKHMQALSFQTVLENEAPKTSAKLTNNDPPNSSSSSSSSGYSTSSSKEPPAKKLSLNSTHELLLADSKKYQKPVALGKQTPLMTAVYNKDSVALNENLSFLGHATKKMLTLDIDGETVSFPPGTTALMIAARIGFLDGVRLLIREARIRNVRDETAIMMAAVGNHANCIEELVPYEVRTRDMYGYTSLMKTAQLNNYDAARVLCLHESGLMSRRHRSALHMAADRVNVDVVRLLAKYEARLLDAKGETALLISITKANRDMIVALGPLEGNLSSMDGQTPLGRLGKYKKKFASREIYDECRKAIMLCEKKPTKDLRAD